MIMKIANLAACIATALLLTAPLAKAADWPQWLGPNQNGISSEKITWPASGPKQLWKVVVGQGYSGISISKGRVYTMGLPADVGHETVWCLDAKTGAVIWKYVYADNFRKPVIDQEETPSSIEKHTYDGPRSTPCVDGNIVYAISKVGSLVALDAAKGTLVWSADFRKDFSEGRPFQWWGFCGSPVVDGNLLLVNVGMWKNSKYLLVAYEKLTGKMVWRSGSDQSVASPITFTLDSQRIVMIHGVKGLSAFDLADGKPLWNSDWVNKDFMATDPIIFGDKIFLSGAYHAGCRLLKVTRNSATEVYKNNNLRCHFSTPVMVDGMIYGISGYVALKPVTDLVCLDVNTGEVKWIVKEHGSRGLIAAGNILLILGGNGHLIAAEASPAGYKEIGNVPVFTGSKEIGKDQGATEGQYWTTPSLANGCVYLRNTINGEVVCLDLGNQ